MDTEGTREEPGTLTQGVDLFSLLPLVWESNPKLQGGWCKTQPPVHWGILSQPSGDLEPTQGGAVLYAVEMVVNPGSWRKRDHAVCACVYYCVCVCLLLQDLVQSCLRVGGILEDMCHERRRAESCVD